MEKSLNLSQNTQGIGLAVAVLLFVVSTDALHRLLQYQSKLQLRTSNSSHEIQEPRQPTLEEIRRALDREAAPYLASETKRTQMTINQKGEVPHFEELPPINVGDRPMPGNPFLKKENQE